jgi:hypothetical protein
MLNASVGGVYAAYWMRMVVLRTIQHCCSTLMLVVRARVVTSKTPCGEDFWVLACAGGVLKIDTVLLRSQYKVSVYAHVRED